MLHGRATEKARIDGLLTGARSGRSAALALTGEAGIGKSALLDYAAEGAGDMRVLRGSGIESESELPYAGLHLLLGRAVERIDTLPEQQAGALAAALGRGGALGGDRFLVGLAVLTLLSELAEERPLLCLVDDAHWLDGESADALLFAARRLDAEGVVMLLAVREPHAPKVFTAGLAELRLTGLDAGNAQAVLAEQAADLSAHDRGTVLAQAGGNPLALRELAVQCRVGRLGSASAPLPSRLQAAFSERIEELPIATQTLVLVAAAEDLGDAATALDAARALGAEVADLGPAERERLLRVVGDRIEFGHPLVRSAAYHSAPLARRIAAHQALAEALGEEQADRRAWHLAAAATGPDEKVAAGLEGTAEHARARGGLPAAAEAYSRAAALSSDPHARARRLIAAAQAEADTGTFDRAAELVTAAGEPEEPAQRAAIARVRAMLHDAMGDPAAACAEIEKAAQFAEPGEAIRMLHFAVRVAWATSDYTTVTSLGARAAQLDGGGQVQELARAAVELAETTRHAGPGGVVPAGVLHTSLPDTADPRDRVLYARLHLGAGDFSGARSLATQLEYECRAQGALAILPEVLMIQARVQLFSGRHQEALATGEDCLRLSELACQWQARLNIKAILAELAAIRGEEQRCAQLAAEPASQGVAPGAAQAQGALSLLDVGYGRYEAALDRLEQTAAGPVSTGVTGSLPLMVEAAVRLNLHERAAAPAEAFAAAAERTGQPWMRALALRCRALLSGEEEPYRQALEVVDHPFEHARTALLYGEWLRRARRTTEARNRLRSVVEAFERLGTDVWAERARGELRAAGESRGAREHAENPAERLTAQELQVVRLAARGKTNREIGAQLYLSPRTVGYHLYNAYPKLGVASRGQLAGLGLARETG